jgi:hypothetical protein
MSVEVGDIVQYGNKSNEYVVIKVYDNDSLGRRSYDLLTIKVGGDLDRGGHIFKQHPFEPETILTTKVKDTRLARKLYPNAEVLDNGMLRIKEK